MTILSKYRTLIGAVIMSGAVIGNPAQAVSLNGNSITAVYLSPDLDTVYHTVSILPSSTFFVGAGVEAVTFVGGNPNDIDFDDTSLVLTLVEPVGWTVYPFNGWQFTNNSGNFGADFSVTGIDPSRVSVLANVLRVNWSGVAFNSGDQVRVDFSTVPEPANWALMIAGFGLVGATARRRRVAVVA